MNRLAKWLEKNSKTQDELAEAIGVTQPYVSRLVSGERGPGLAVALAIEKFTRGAVPAVSWDEPDSGSTRSHHS